MEKKIIPLADITEKRKASMDRRLFIKKLFATGIFFTASPAILNIPYTKASGLKKFADLLEAIADLLRDIDDIYFDDEQCIECGECLEAAPSNPLEEQHVDIVINCCPVGCIERY